MNRILIVAYHFPPVGGLGAAGSQRIHKFAKHLPANDWQPYVLTVKESAYESYLKIDPSLLEEVSPDLPVIRTGVFHVLVPLLNFKNSLLRRNPSEYTETLTDEKSDPAAASQSESRNPPAKSAYQRFKDALTDLFEIPDEVAGWQLPAVIAGFWAIRKQKIDIILATGRPWSTLVIGAVLKRLTGKPLVLDFRDPWMTNPFRPEPSPFKNRIEARLERWVIGTADLIVANTDNLRQEFVERFGDDLLHRCVTVINGFDVEEFSKIEPLERSDDLKDTFVLLHAGFLYGKRDPKSLIDAIGILRDRGDLDRTRFRCDLIGSIELNYDLSDYIEGLGLGEYVHLGGEISYAESIANLAACDAALLLQPGTATQIPSKVFEYVGLGRRMITIAPPDSAVASLVLDHKLGVVADPDDTVAIADVIGATLQNWRENGNRHAIDKNSQAHFDVRNSVEKLSSEMRSLVK